MDEITVIDLNYRNVSDQSISKTFKGILRIAHIKEIMDGQEDVFLNNTYYGVPKKLMDISGSDAGAGVGYASAGGALAGSVKRYDVEDEYFSLKVPVTDSIGEYLNYNVGNDGVTFGRMYANTSRNLDTITATTKDGETFEQSRFYPSLASDSIQLGLDESDKLHYGKLSIEDGPAAVGGMVIDNESDQRVGKNKNSYRKLEKNEERRRTIYESTRVPKEYDVLMYQQENYDKHNVKLGSLDAHVNVIDFKKYVRTRINKLINAEFVSVPTGSVIWQYVNMNKWFGSEPGNCPALGPNADDEYTDSRTQGVCVKTNTLLGTNQNGYTENIPLYKRDYTICDGSMFYMHLRRGRVSTDVALERFLNLFYTIGYEYTPVDKIKNHNVYNIETDESGNLVRMKLQVSDTKDYDCLNFKKVEKYKDIAYAMDMALILAYMELDKAAKAGSPHVMLDGVFNREKAENYLKTLSIDKRYPITSPFTHYSSNQSTDPSVYCLKYDKTILSDVDFAKKAENSDYQGYCFGKAFKNPDSSKDDICNGIEMGREINTFGDPILCFAPKDNALTMDEESEIECKICRVYQLPEIQYLLDQFEKSLTYDDLYEYFKIKFCVPDFNIEVQRGKFVGGMIGFSEGLISESGTVNLGSSYTVTDIPHRHYIFRGDLSYPRNGYTTHLKGTDAITSSPDSMPTSAVCYCDEATIASFGNYGHDFSYSISEVWANFDETDPLGSQMTSATPCSHVGTPDYFTKYAYRANAIANKDGGPSDNMTIDANRCPTSDATSYYWDGGAKEKYELGLNQASTTGSGTAFTPESCLMLPLIKL